jgi:hypothetical protein
MVVRFGQHLTEFERLKVYPQVFEEIPPEFVFEVGPRMDRRDSKGKKNSYPLGVVWIQREF